MTDSENIIGQTVAAAMRLHLHLRQQEQALGIDKVCDGVFFVTKQETIAALDTHFKEMFKYMGVKVMVPK